MMVINEGVVINCRYVVDLSSETLNSSHYKERKIAININKTSLPASYRLFNTADRFG